MTKKNGGDEEDKRLWRRVTADVRPLADAKRAKTAGRKPATASETAKASRRDPASLPPHAARKTPAGKVPDFDGDTGRKLRKGKMAVEGRIDLHGMTQAAAQAALMRFIARAISRGQRTLLVITGKGSAKAGGGVLRRMLPLWLEAPEVRPHIVAFSPARAQDGGDGAFYVRLRKNK